MEQKRTCQSENLWMKYSSITLPIHWALTFISICCILQFFVIGVINLIRGYSIGTFLPHVILLAGVFVLLALSLKYRKKNRRLFSFYFYTLEFGLGYCILTGLLSQGGYLKKAEKYYSTGQYQQALLNYEKEAQTWYHLLKYL